MEVKFAKLFEKDLSRIKEKQVVLKVDELIKALRTSKTIQDISGVKKAQRP